MPVTVDWSSSYPLVIDTIATNFPVLTDDINVVRASHANQLAKAVVALENAVAAAQVGNALFLQNRAISATAPTNGQALIWNTTNNDWEPGAAGAPLGSATPQNVSGSASAGVATSSAREDHVHTIASGTITSAMLTTILQYGVDPSQVYAVSTSGAINANARVVLVDSTAGALSLTLPAISIGRTIVFIKTSTDTNSITLVRSGTETINGTAANYTPASSVATWNPRWTLYDTGASARWIERHSPYVPVAVPADQQVPYWDNATGSTKWASLSGAPMRYTGVVGKVVTQIGSEYVVGAIGAFDPTVFGAPTVTFDATYNFTPGTSGSVEIRLYDMGTRASPTSGTLRSTISTTYLNAGVQQCVSRTLSVSASPGTNTDQIQNAERVYEIRAIMISATAGDALSIEISSLTVTAGSILAGGTSGVTWTTVSAAIAAANSSVNVNTQKIVNVVDPVSAQDAATKNYVDNTKSIATIQTVSAGGSVGSPVQITAYTTMVECTDATTITYLILPTLVNAPIGTVIQVSKANTSSFKINVKPDSGSSINGGTTDTAVDVPNSVLASSATTQDVIVQFRRTGVSTWRMA